MLGNVIPYDTTQFCYIAKSPVQQALANRSPSDALARYRDEAIEECAVEALFIDTEPYRSVSKAIRKLKEKKP